MSPILGELKWLWRSNLWLFLTSSVKEILEEIDGDTGKIILELKEIIFLPDLLNKYNY